MQHDPTSGSAHSTSVLSHCTKCAADLEVLRVIAGRAGSEYWALQCTDCGGIHLDIIKTSPTLTA